MKNTQETFHADLRALSSYNYQAPFGSVPSLKIPFKKDISLLDIANTLGTIKAPAGKACRGSDLLYERGLFDSVVSSLWFDKLFCLDDWDFVSDNVIKLNKFGRLFANNPFWLSDNFSFNENLSIFIFENYLKPLDFKKSYALKALNKVIGSLIMSSESNRPVLFQRDLSKNTSFLIRIIDVLAKNNFLFQVIGSDYQNSKNASWFQPTDEFTQAYKKLKLKVSLDDSSLIELRDSNKQNKSLNRAKRRQKTKYTQAFNQLKNVNTLLLEHDFTVADKTLVPQLKRVYNLSDDLDLGGRFYGDYQSLPSGKKTQDLDNSYTRQNIKIDGEQTVEPDFSAMHYSLLYAIAGKQLKTDPYIVSGFDRKTIKLASLVLLNSEDLSRFKANITKSGSVEIQRVYAEYTAKRQAFDAGLTFKEPTKPKCLNGYIDGMPTGIKGDDLLNALMNRHKPISHLFGSKNIGLRLQNLDAKIMSNTLETLLDKRIPALPVHDSLRCKISDAKDVMEAMHNAYSDVMNGFYIKVDCDDFEENKEEDSIEKEVETSLYFKDYEVQEQVKTIDDALADFEMDRINFYQKESEYCFYYRIK